MKEKVSLIDRILKKKQSEKSIPTLTRLVNDPEQVFENINSYSKLAEFGYKPIVEFSIPYDAKIAFISDLHFMLALVNRSYDKWQLKAILKLAEDNDYLFINGDLFDGIDPVESILKEEIFAEFFDELLSHPNVYLTIGNHDRTGVYRRNFVRGLIFGQKKFFYDDKFIDRFEDVANLFLIKQEDKDGNVKRILWIEHGDRLVHPTGTGGIKTVMETYPASRPITYAEIFLRKFMTNKNEGFMERIVKKIFEFMVTGTNKLMKRWISSNIKMPSEHELFFITGHSHLAEDTRMGSGIRSSSEQKEKDNVYFLNSGTMRPDQNGQALIICGDDRQFLFRHEILGEEK